MLDPPCGDGSFAELLSEARSGSDEAAAELVAVYGPYVMRAIRRTLSRELRGKFDSQDFAQAVWASLFTAPELLDGVRQPNQLIALLASMARNKVVDELRRRLQGQKYSVRREVPMNDEADGLPNLPSRDPTPSQFAIARERWLALLRSQPDQHRQVIRMRLMGKTNRSIARHLGLSERTVGRIFERLTDWRIDGPAEAPKANSSDDVAAGKRSRNAAGEDERFDEGTARERG